MASSVYRSCPPYEGTDPYLYLCFAKEDEKSAAPLLLALQKRGCRTWYSLGRTADKAENARRTERIKNASLMALLLRSETASDGTLRGNLGYCLSLQKPVILVELAPLAGETGLELLLGERHPGRIQAKDAGNPEELAAAIMRTEGFTQDLFSANAAGQPGITPYNPLKKIAAFVLLFAALAMAGAFFYGRSNNWFRQTAQDTVSLTDPSVQKAARAALSADGSVPLTEETVGQVTDIRLNELPESMAALEELPNLTRIEIPQSAVSGAGELLSMGRYTIVVYGEAGK